MFLASKVNYNMIELLIEYKPLILQFFDIIVRLFAVPLVTLGIVYIFGRMLEILRFDRPKNILAILSIYMLQFLYELFAVNLHKPAEVFFKTLIEKGWSIFLYGSVSIVIYVTLCWRLYNRVDKFLDKKIGSDEEFKPKRKK